MSDAKKQGAGVMRVSAFDRSNWAKMSRAAKGAGLESVAKKFGAAACLPVGEEIPLSVFDQLQSEWRDWLVSGKFRHGVTVHPVARAVRAESLTPVPNDLITQLREALEMALGCLKCHAADCHRDGLPNAAASAERAVSAAVKAIANAKGL
jgi:hypothetical protein